MQLRKHNLPDHKPDIFVMGGDLQEIVLNLTSIYDKKYPHVEYNDSPLGYVNFIISPENITIIALTKHIICKRSEQQRAEFQFEPFEVHAYGDELKRAVKKLKKNSFYILSFTDNNIYIFNDKSHTITDIGLRELKIKTLDMIDQVMSKDFDFSYNIKSDDMKFAIKHNRMVNKDSYGHEEAIVMDYQKDTLEILNTRFTTTLDSQFLIIEFEKLSKCLNIFDTSFVMSIKHKKPPHSPNVAMQDHKYFVFFLGQGNRNDTYVPISETTKKIYRSQ